MSEGSKYQVRAVFDEALNLFERKNADYGDAWRLQGWRGNLSRVMEKVQRLRTALWRGGPVVAYVGDEDARQTALDMLNTLAFFIVNWDERKEWGHEISVRVPGKLPPEAISQYFSYSYSPETSSLPLEVRGAEPLPATDQMREDAATAQAWPGGMSGETLAERPRVDDAPSLAPRKEQGKRKVSDIPQA